MVPYELQKVSLMQMEIFFRCAELLNFTKVASELRITPGMVSKKIATLESSLGFALFQRESNRVTLTTHGEALYAAWRQPVETMMLQAAEIRGRETKADALTFALWESTNLERFFVPLISAYSAENEMLFRINMRDDLYVLEDIASGKSDIAFMPKFAERGIREMDGLDHFLALPSPLYAAVSAENPLAKKKKFRVEDLRDMNLMMPQDGLAWYADMVEDLCFDHGFEPKIRLVERGVFRANYLCMDKDSVMITDKYFHAFSSNAVEYRELEKTESGLLMVYRRDAPAHVRHLVEFARTFYRDLR